MANKAEKAFFQYSNVITKCLQKQISWSESFFLRKFKLKELVMRISDLVLKIGLLGMTLLESYQLGYAAYRMRHSDQENKYPLKIQLNKPFI